MIHKPINPALRSTSPRSQTVLIGDDDATFCHVLAVLLRSAGYSVIIAADGHAVVRLAQEQMPDLLLVDLVMPQLDGYEALRQLRNDTRTAHIPMIVLSARGSPADLVSGFESGADDYITKPVLGEELLARIAGHLRRASRLPVHSPLTGLAGNQLLLEELRYRQRRGDSFAMLHFDLKAFKAFNDYYGFARGDQAIHALADGLRATVATCSDQTAFLGHIGGDDFVVVCRPEAAEPLCREAIARFDALAPYLYDEAERARGYLLSLDRDGVPRRFSLMGLVAGGAVHTPGRFGDPDGLSRCVAEMKQQAKQRGGSAYCISAADDQVPVIGPRVML